MPPAPTLVLGDIHNHVDQADKILRSLAGSYSRVVFLGDYFDDFNDGPAEVAHTARWLAASLENPEHVHLLGNHDLAYLFPDNPHLSCAGFSTEKWLAVSPILRKAPLDRLKLAHCENGWLLSHAGFHPEIAEGEPAEVLATEANRILRGLGHNRYHAWLAGSPARGFFNERVPGITWMDWEEEFEPVPGLNQIVGHSPCSGTVRGRHLRADGSLKRAWIIKSTGDLKKTPELAPHTDGGSSNWCLDTDLKMVGLLDCSGPLTLLLPRPKIQKTATMQPLEPKADKT